MLLRRLFSSMFGLLALAVIGMAAIGGAMFLGVSHAVDTAVKLDAEQKALDWADYFIDSMPRLAGLIETGDLDAEQRELVTTAEQVGGIFRFKLFDAHGGVVLVSDEMTYAAEPLGQRDHSATAAEVLETGVSDISLNDGTGKTNRPPLYVEAYVPVTGDDGTARGVVEVYIDQTATAALMRSTFTALAAGVALAAALAFGLPSLGFVLRSRQAREAKQRVEFLAHHDAMTGLMNRARFTEMLEARLTEPASAGQVLVFFDVDDFKGINDSFGHEAGDEFLRHVARALTENCGGDALIARLGGDEFTLVIPDKDAVIAIVERIMSAVGAPLGVRGKTILGRISAGICMIGEEPLAMADAMHKADIALYQAKLDGGNLWRVFSHDMEAAIQKHRELEHLLRDATAWGAFELHYQPLLHAETHVCAGFEALLRLPDGKGGLIPPAHFIPIAEDMGLINEIGNWVLERATQTAAEWPEHLFVSVNLSVKQFQDGRLVDNVRQALDRAGLPANRLELEVTESMLMQNTSAIAAQLEELKAMGVSIAMDDFGTGYSSLGYLWQFGFDKIKIDRSFITALGHQDRQTREILDTIIMLGHKLDMTVTAEGIETEAQADVLTALACDHFQGYLFGRPAPAHEITAMLAQAEPAGAQRLTS